MSRPIVETLDFVGYTLEDDYERIPENVRGVYCAYACLYDNDKKQWIGTDIVYFGRSDSDIRGRVYKHRAENDNARKTLKEGEKLIYCYARTDYEIECEKALVAAHADLPRLANDKLTGGYKGPEIHLQVAGKASGIRTRIDFASAE